MLAAGAVATGCTTAQRPVAATVNPIIGANSSPLAVDQGSPSSPSPATVAKRSLPGPASAATVPSAHGAGMVQAALIRRVATADPVVFITIDDGYVRDGKVLSYLRVNHIPVTAFLTTAAVHHGRTGITYFRRLHSEGAALEDHTVTHPFLAGRALADQRAQICQAADTEAAWFGSRPYLFRPPYGSYDTLTRIAAAACGMSDLVLWQAEATDGRWVVQGGHLLPGMIVLVHWHKSLLSDLRRTMSRILAAGLRPGLLEDYLPRPALAH